VTEQIDYLEMKPLDLPARHLGGNGCGGRKIHRSRRTSHSEHPLVPQNLYKDLVGLTVIASL
jgi:hypothetical protein